MVQTSPSLNFFFQNILVECVSFYVIWPINHVRANSLNISSFIEEKRGRKAGLHGIKAGSPHPSPNTWFDISQFAVGNYTKERQKNEEKWEKGGNQGKLPDFEENVCFKDQSTILIFSVSGRSEYHEFWIKKSVKWFFQTSIFLNTSKGNKTISDIISFKHNVVPTSVVHLLVEIIKTWLKLSFWVRQTK